VALAPPRRIVPFDALPLVKMANEMRSPGACSLRRVGDFKVRANFDRKENAAAKGKRQRWLKAGERAMLERRAR